MKRTKQTWLLLFVGIILLVPLMIPLLPGTIAVGWDMVPHLSRIWALHQSINDGTIPPRWSSFLAFGYGSPVLMFNWSLPYYIGDIFFRIYPSLFMAFRCVTALTIIASFASMYLFLLCVSTSPLWACIGAILFSFAPYKINILYLRGTMGEPTALVFWPLILLSVFYLFQKYYRKGILLGSLTLSLCMLSHHVLFLMIVPVYLGYIGIRYAETKNGKAVILGIIALAWSMGLTAYFWIPAFSEKSFLGFSSIQTLYRDNFLSFRTLISHPWFLPFGQAPWQLLYAIGWPCIIAFVLSCVSVGVRMKHASAHGQKNLTRLCSIVACGSIFLLTNSSEFVWAHIPFITNFVYPQRFLGLVTFSASILMTLFLSEIGIKKQLRPVLFFCTLVGIIGLSSPYIMLNRATIPIHFNKLDIPVLNTTDMTAEFMPKTIPEDFLNNQAGYEQRPLMLIASGQGNIRSCVQKSSSISCQVYIDTASIISIRQFFFPGWTAYADGKQVPLISNPKDGTILIEVPEKTSVITVSFQNTPLRMVANLITILSILCFLGILLFLFTKKLSHIFRYRK